MRASGSSPPVECPHVAETKEAFVPGPTVLVYNRIDKNHRNTRILVALLPLIVLPFAAGMTWWFGAQLSFYRMFYGPLFSIAMIVTTITVILQAAWIYHSTMLRAIDATPIALSQEPNLHRIVANLCIGAGLPQPRIYLVDSAVPNAFATGRDPQHAKVCVTRGLLALLDDRELQGVLAHELSHIGNHDTRLNTMVAAVLAALRLPIGIVVGTYRSLAAVQPVLGILFLFGFIGVFCGFFSLIFSLSIISFSSLASVSGFRWMVWHLTPVFVLFGAPVLGLFIRQAISREREFLADADAVLLTRDSEGLALALTKIGAWRGPGKLKVGSSAAHLCIVDPLPTDAAWWDTIFPCHPPIQDRVNLLARMGNGISESALGQPLEAAGEASVCAIAKEALSFDPQVGAASQSSHRATTLLYEQADGWSKVLDELPKGAMVTLSGAESSFLKVTTIDHIVGYISQARREHVSFCGSRVASEVCGPVAKNECGSGPNPE